MIIRFFKYCIGPKTQLDIVVVLKINEINNPFVTVKPPLVPLAYHINS